MRFPLLLAALFFSIGTLVRIFGGPFWFFFIVAVPLFFKPKLLVLFSFAFLGFWLSFRPNLSGGEILGKVVSFSSRGSVVSDMKISLADGWKNIPGKALSKKVGVGKRVYCKGIVSVRAFPEYELKKCWDFPLDLSLMDRLKIKIWGVRERLLKKSSISLNMVLSKPMKVAREAGVSHLFAFSGFHTGVVFYMMILFVSSFFSSMFFVYPISVILIIPMILMSGPSPSAVRAYTFLVLFVVSKLLDYPVSKLNALGLSALVSMIYDPRIVLSPSFVLSYSATLGVLVAVDNRKSWWKIPIYAYIFSLPGILVFFREVNLLSPVLSIILSPLSMMMIFIAEIAAVLALFGGWGIANILITGLSPFDKVVEDVLKLFSKFPKIKLPIFLSVVLSLTLLWLIGKLLRGSSERSYESTDLM